MEKVGKKSLHFRPLVMWPPASDKICLGPAEGSVKAALTSQGTGACGNREGLA